MDKTADSILVVGAGPVGLFCALMLKRLGLSCRIMDTKPGPSEHSKALGLHIRTLDMLKECDLIEPFLEQGTRVHAIDIRARGKRLASLRLSEAKASWPFMLDIPQARTEAIFIEALANRGLNVEWNHRLIGIKPQTGDVRVNIQTPQGEQEQRYRYVIACDGASSFIRGALNANMSEHRDSETYWLADLNIQWHSKANRLITYLSDEGPLACFPLGNHQYRIVMTRPEGSDEAPNLESMAKIFAERSQEIAELKNPNWLSQFHVRYGVMSHYRHHHIFFAGDAAHVHSPIGGQGLNTGLQDIYNLAWKLKLVIQHHASDKLLDSYHEERHPIGADIVKKTAIFTRALHLKHPVLQTLRNTLIRTVNAIPKLREMVVKRLAELCVNYRKSRWVAELGNKTALRAGDYLPDMVLNVGDSGQKGNLHDLLPDDKYHLLLFIGEQEDTPISLLLDVAHKINLRLGAVIEPHLVLNTTAHPPKTPSVFLDSHHYMHQSWRIEHPTAILVRPDKYIALVQSPINLPGILHYLSDIGLSWEEPSSEYEKIV